MNLSEVMQRNVQVICGAATVREAAERMSALNVGVLPVYVDGRIAGIVTDRDLVIRSLAQGGDPDKARVSDVMTKEIEWCFEDEPIDEAASKMSERQIQRVLVLDRAKKLVGIVALADLVRGRGDEPAVGRTVEQIKAPTKPSAVGTGARHVGH